jgi:hypothetical protein
VKDFETFYDLICFFFCHFFWDPFYLFYLQFIFYFLICNFQPKRLAFVLLLQIRFITFFSFLVHPFLASYVFLSTFSLRQNHLFFYSNLLSLF